MKRLAVWGRKWPIILALALFWLALSGHYTLFLLVVGAACCLATTALLLRMKVLDEEGQPFHLIARGLAYWPWLAKEMLLSAWRVALIILHPRLPIAPALRVIATPQKTLVGQVTFANSITLTPGTLTLELTDDGALVHGLQAQGLDELEAGGMSRRVLAMEGSG